jgi:hypothetical protein
MSMVHDQAIERSIDNVQSIYAVIIALAISEAIETLLKATNSTTGEISFAEARNGLCAFVAFLFTVVPFWQGMNRHLDRCYLEKENSVKHSVLLLDLGVFLAEAIVLFGAGLLIKSGIVTFYWLALLLGIDMVWAVGSHYIHSRGLTPHSLKWSLINICAILVAVVAFVFFDMCPHVVFARHRQFVLMVIAVGRTIADYKLCLDFYFPETSRVSA